MRGFVRSRTGAPARPDRKARLEGAHGARWAGRARDGRLARAGQARAPVLRWGSAFAAVLFCCGIALAETNRAFDTWFCEAFGVRVGRMAAGRISAKRLPNLAEQASTWYRRNGKEGQTLSEVTVYARTQGDFLFLEFDISASWPEATYVKRHVVYYLGAQNPYALVADEIEGAENDFWTMQLPLPDETVPVNWAIDLKDAGRRADLLAGIASEFDVKPELNKPVSGYAKAKSGSQMLLARLLQSNDMANKYADKMSPMNIRVQGGRKWLTTEVRSKAPSIKFAIMPYSQNRDELPQTIISETSTRMDWYKKSHQYMFHSGTDGSLALMLKDKEKGKLNKLAFRMEYQEVARPKGELVAAYDFEALANNKAKDKVGGFDADIERGRLVDGLMGKSIYLGYPDRPKRNAVPAGILIPEAIREELKAGHLSISFWYKSPMGQAKGDKKSWMWPIGEIMRERQYLDTGFFSVGHLHYSMAPITKGFNAAWQERANSGEITPGKWNHLVFTMQELDADEFLYRYEVYVNGIIRTSRELGPMKDRRHCQTWNQVKGPIKVGDLWGTIDNLMLYNYPLSEEEILALYDTQLEKQVSYYSCDTLGDDGTVESVPVGDYPEDSILNNHWVAERTFAGRSEGATQVPGVKGGALAFKQGLTIPEKALWDLSQGAFTFSFYFKYSGKGTKIINVEGGGVRLNIGWNKFHGAIGNQWEDKYLGQNEGGVSADQWHHLVLAYDKRTMKMVLDGKQLYDRPMASTEGINFGKPITLGGNCEIDEITNYNYAIDDAEVKRLAQYLNAN